MAQDQINQLAEEYARHRLPNPLTYDDDSLFADYRQQAKAILEWLLSDHVVIDKELANKIWITSCNGKIDSEAIVTRMDFVERVVGNLLYPDEIAPYKPTEK